MKTVGTWSIDIDVKAWIDRKIANKSQFVNRILKQAYIAELEGDQKRKERPKCPVCRTYMRHGDAAGENQNGFAAISTVMGWLNDVDLFFLWTDRLHGVNIYLVPQERCTRSEGSNLYALQSDCSC